MSDQCERCESELATIFCLRCKQAICVSCYEPSLGLCYDCVNYKKATEWDRRQLVRTFADSATAASTRLEKDMCYDCEILRHHLLYMLKALKNMELDLEREDLSNLKEHVIKLREVVIPLVVEAVAQHKLSADPTAWRRL
ncbi:MAG: B-box zinc finger protein [Candidatus Heimdallarchaeota archaeon]